MKRTICILFHVVILLAFASHMPGAEEVKIQKNFPAMKALEIHTVSGDCVITAGDSKGITITVTHTYTKNDYSAEFNESEDTLVMREKFLRHGSFSGSSLWEISIPAGTNVQFVTASGDLKISGTRGRLEAKTASGDIDLKDSEGEFDIHSASGDLTLINLKGTLSAKSASGDVRLEKVAGGKIKASSASGDVEAISVLGEIKLTSASGDVEVEAFTGKGIASFTSASGDVFVKLDAALQNDISLTSASGDAVLDFNGHPMKGEFIMTAKKKGGEISAPFSFDKSEEYEEYGQAYIKKTAVRNGSTPKIEVNTATGQAKITGR